MGIAAGGAGAKEASADAPPPTATRIRSGRLADLAPTVLRLLGVRSRGGDIDAREGRGAPVDGDRALLGDSRSSSAFASPKGLKAPKWPLGPSGPREALGSVLGHGILCIYLIYY